MKYLAIFGIPLAIIAAIVLMFVSYYNTGTDYETNIDKQVADNQNVLSTMSNTVFDQLGIADQYKGSVVEVIKAGIEGRYGAKGSSAFVQAMTEAYPATLDASAYTRIQNTIEAKRNEFQNSQRKLIDMVGNYKNATRRIPGKLFYGLMGFPGIDLTEAKYNPVISSSTAETFRTGVDNGLGLYKPR